MSIEFLFDPISVEDSTFLNLPIQIEEEEEEEDGRSEGDLSQQDEVEGFESQQVQDTMFTIIEGQTDGKLDFEIQNQLGANSKLLSAFSSRTTTLTSTTKKRGRPLKKKFSGPSHHKKQKRSNSPLALPQELTFETTLQASSPETPPNKRRRGRPKKLISSSSSESLPNFSQDSTFLDSSNKEGSWLNSSLSSESQCSLDSQEEIISNSNPSDLELTNFIRILISQYQSQITIEQINEDLRERYGGNLIQSRKWFISEVFEIFQL